MRKFLAVILLFVIMAITAHPAMSAETKKERMRIAVMDLKGEGISRKTVRTVSNMLRTDLINMGSFVVVERAQIDQILKEHELQQTGCTDNACVVEMGKLLSARKILVGEISTLGKEIIMTVRVVDIEKGVSEFAVSEKAESESVLDRAVNNIAKKLVASIEGRKVEDRITEMMTLAYVFLKDGSIVEGRILNETDNIIKIIQINGKMSDIPKTNILRVLHNEDYKQIQYICKTDGKVLEAYVVDENQEEFIYRLEYDSAKEFKISKKDVTIVSKKKIEKPRREEIATRTARVRIGIGISPIEGDLKDYYSNGLSRTLTFFQMANIDIFPYRWRYNESSGVDLMLRGLVKHYSQKNISKSDYIRITGMRLSPYSTNTEDGGAIVIGGDIGIRYITGIYYFGILWQPYVFLAYQFFPYVNEDFGYPSNGNENAYSINTSSLLGIVGGCGLDIGIFSYLGLFMELNYGYNPANLAIGKNKNVDGLNFLYGITFRTSFVD